MTASPPPGSRRPTVMATRHMAVAGHYLAAQAAFQVLEAGGNAVDAGVAGGIALGVVEPEFVSFAGVAPIILSMAETGEVVTLTGLGGWPKAADCDVFMRHHGGHIPKGVLRTVVPGAPDAWITALERYGTMSFGDVAAAAIRFAREGFPVSPLKAAVIAAEQKTFALWPSSAAVFLPKGRPPQVGEMFVQADLAQTLQHLADEEKAHAGHGRAAGLDTVRAAFYRGDLARTMVDWVQSQGGWLAMEDLAGFRVDVERALRVRFGDLDVWGCGPWCQGPMLLQNLRLVEHLDFRALGHNSPSYIHALTEAIKLAAADREAYYADPKFVDVPIERLLSDAYTAERRRAIDPRRAAPAMPAPGDVGRGRPAATQGGGGRAARSPDEADDRLNTSYVCVVDRHGNAFSTTPSDGGSAVPVVPGTGLVLAPRGGQSWGDPRHLSSVAPGKRPRLTTNPAIAMGPGRTVMPFGTPGADVQTQAMLQVLINLQAFGMQPQAAVEAPRFASYSFPQSTEPHDDHLGLLKLEGRIDGATGEALAAMGHRVEWWPDRNWLAGSVCLIRADRERGVMYGAADDRRTAYALGL